MWYLGSMTVLPHPNFILLYVKAVPESVSFYTDLLQQPPVESSPNFAMFAFSSGVMLGLWARHDVQPAPTALAGTGELCITLASVEAVQAVHHEWLGRGINILQAPTKMDFGYTFVAGDPDGHRIRAFFPTGS